MTRSTRNLIALVCAFLAGALVDSWLRVYGPPKPVARRVSTPTMTAEPEKPPADHRLPPPLAPISAVPSTVVGTSGRGKLRMPIDGIDVESMKGGFDEARSGHPHEAVDILAARSTPVHAVQSGTIAKLFVSKAGGITIYQFDPTGRICYYYAHLERYADELHEGEPVAQGQIIGFVGTSGNAPRNTPHLHFAVFELGSDQRWWKGKAIDPYNLFKNQS